MTDDTDARVIRAEMKAHAMAAGIVDPDAVRLLDLSAVKLDAKGEVAIPAGFFDAARQAKPYLFCGTSSTSSSATPPPAAQPVQKHARDMTPAEFAAAKRAMGIYR